MLNRIIEAGTKLSFKKTISEVRNYFFSKKEKEGLFVLFGFQEEVTIKLYICKVVFFPLVVLEGIHVVQIYISLLTEDFFWGKKIFNLTFHS